MSAPLSPKVATVEGGHGKVSYYDVLLENSSVIEDFPEFMVKDGVVEVEIPISLMEDAEPLWRSFIVGYFMNDAPHIGSIHAMVYRIWASQGKKSRIDVQFIGKTTVLFRIEDAAVRNRILKRKFWHISDVPLMLGEWTPETARSPPDLSVMPLWVDLMNVQGYLYSKKGLSFLSRTSGKFIKLHPNTEHCVRMDVARVLVEVDLTKPLPNKISFKGRGGADVLVSISYPWLPPRCTSCSKRGHLTKDFQTAKMENKVGQESVVNVAGSVNDAIVLEGFTAKDATEKSGTEIVATLMDDLEAMSGEASLAGATALVSVAAQTKPLETALNSSEWSLVSYQNSGLVMSSPRAQEDNICVSPNGFQALHTTRKQRYSDGHSDGK
uniref:DUF4283 domain-containing protein n=1 Tax=Brassica oleracea var. oleracea TaxID=109376 RepID=A0A0D3BML3_BRAOL